MKQVLLSVFFFFFLVIIVAYEPSEVMGFGHYKTNNGSNLFLWQAGKWKDLTPESSGGTRWILGGGQIIPYQKTLEKSDPQEKVSSIFLWGIKELNDSRHIWTAEMIWEGKLDSLPPLVFTYYPLREEQVLAGTINSRGECAFLLASALSYRVWLCRNQAVMKRFSWDQEVRLFSLALSDSGRLAAAGLQGNPEQPYLWVDGESLAIPFGWKGILQTLAWSKSDQEEQLKAAGRGKVEEPISKVSTKISTFFFEGSQWSKKEFDGVGFFPISFVILKEKEAHFNTILLGTTVTRPEGKRFFQLLDSDGHLDSLFEQKGGTLVSWVLQNKRQVLLFYYAKTGQHVLIDNQGNLTQLDLPKDSFLRLVLFSNDQLMTKP